MTDKKISFFLCDYSLGTNDTLINIVEVLSQNDYICDIFIYKPNKTDLISFNNPRIRIHILPLFNKNIISKKSDNISVKRFRQQVKKSQLIVKTYNLFRKTKYQIKSLILSICYSINILDKNSAIIPKNIISETLKLIDKDSSICFFGIEDKGLIYASIIKKYIIKPICFLSLELLYKNHPHLLNNYVFNIRKALEKKYHKSAYATIIQDKDRADILNKMTGVKNSKTFYLPVSVKGGPYIEKKDYFTNKFNINKNKIVVTQFGLIHPYRLSLEIAKSINTWSDEYVLVLHGYGDKNCIENIKNIKSEKLFLSLDLVDYKKIPELISSCQIGLLFSVADNINDQLTGASSGRIAHYLQCGLPIVSCSHESVKKIINKYKCGIAVDSISDINNALKKITSDYEYYQNNAIKCFKEKYDFTKNFQPIFKEIQSLTKIVNSSV